MTLKPASDYTEEEILRNAKLHGTVATILANPKARKLVEQAHKLVDPNAPTPTLDQDKPLDERFAAVTNELKEFKDSVAKREAEDETRRKTESISARVEEGIAELRRAGWTDDGIKGVRELMDKEGILNVKIAADHFEKLHPPQVPVKQSGVGGWNFLEQVPDGDADIKALIASKGDNELLVNKMANDALSEFRGSTQRR